MQFIRSYLNQVVIKWGKSLMTLTFKCFISDIIRSLCTSEWTLPKSLILGWNSCLISFHFLYLLVGIYLWSEKKDENETNIHYLDNRIWNSLTVCVQLISTYCCCCDKRYSLDILTVFFFVIYILWQTICSSLLTHQFVF